MCTPISTGLPELGIPTKCKVQHWHTKGIREAKLVRVEEDDCSWRTADDNSELSHDWNVVEWLHEQGKDGMKLSPSKLQAALDALATANNRARIARDKINAYVRSIAGRSPIADD